MSQPEPRTPSPPSSRRRTDSKDRRSKKPKSDKLRANGEGEAVTTTSTSKATSPSVSRSSKLASSSTSHVGGSNQAQNSSLHGQVPGNEQVEPHQSSRTSSSSARPTSPRTSVPAPLTAPHTPPSSVTSSFANLPSGSMLYMSLGAGATEPDLSSTSSLGFGTASDFIMRTLIMDFRDHTRKKLDDILKFGVADKVLLDEFFESDPKIQQQFNSLTNMSQYHPSIIVDSLLKWRRNQLTEVTQMMAAKDTKKLTTKEIGMIEERLRLAVEYIFARALIPILDSLTFHKATLDAGFCNEIEDIAFSFFKAPKKSEEDVDDDSVLGNRKKVPTLYAKVVGILSETRFQDIFPRFLKATTDTPVRSKKSTFIILGVRYVRFFVESAEGIEQSTAFLNSLLRLFKAAQPIEVKQALSELIVRLLRAAILSISPSCDYSTWYSTFHGLYTSHAFHPKKGKHNKETVVLIPLVTAMLCSLKKADFLENYREWLSRLYSALKEFKTRTVALESVLFVVEAYYLKVGNELQSALHLLLEEVGSIILTYCTSRRPINDKGDMLDIYVDLVHAIAQLSLSYTVDEVLFKLLTFSAPTPTGTTESPATSNPTPTPSLTSTSFLPFSPFSSAPNPYAFACEKVIVAVRAIGQLRLGETCSNEKTSKRLFTMAPKDLLTIVYNHTIQATAAPITVSALSTAAAPTSAAGSSKDKEKDKDSKDKDLIPLHSPTKDGKDKEKAQSTSDKKDKETGKAKDAPSSISAASISSPTFVGPTPLIPVTSLVAPPMPPIYVPLPAFYSNLASREALLNSLNPYWDTITTYWAQVLLHLDSVLGHLLYSTSYKTLYDMIRPDRDIIAIQLLQMLLQSIPTVVPKVPITKLVSILAKYIIHLDKGIEEMATAALSRLMNWRPEFRPFIISGLAEFATTLSHNRHDLIFTLLFKLGQLFKQWLDIIKPPFELPKGSHLPPSTAADLDSFPVTKIEGIALIFLCSPKSKIRLLALEILKSVRSVETLLRKTTQAPPSPDLSSSHAGVHSSIVSQSPFGLEPTRIMDIIDEAGPDIIRTLQSDSRYFSLQAIPVTVKTIDRLAAREAREDQWLWSSVLGELLRHFSLLQPEPALLAAYLIQSRLREVKPDDKEIPPEQEEMLYWWRNYITFECVTLVPQLAQILPPIIAILGISPASSSFSLASTSLSASTTSTSSAAHTAPSHGHSHHLSVSSISGTYSMDKERSSTSGPSRESTSISRESSLNATFLLPKDIFAMILPYIKSNNDLLRESGVMALQRTNFASAEILAECLRTFEKEFQGEHSEKKRKQKRNRLRLEVTSIYTSIVESIHQTALCRNPPLKKHIVNFITELHQHLKSNRNIFDMLQLRYQYCVIVSHVAEELYAGTLASKDFEQTKEEISLRKNAFNLLSTWCSADIFQDEGTKKHLNSLLSTIKDTEKKKAYVNALREHIMVLQFSALTAMSSCLKGPHFDSILPGNSFFDFVDGFLRHPLDKVRLLARFMLESYLSGNLIQPHVLDTTLNKSYHVDTEIANQYFLCLVALFPEDITLSCSEVVLFHLIVYMIGNSDFHVRRAARELLLMLKSLTNQDEQWLTTVPFVVDSALPENFERAQIDLSVSLANYHPEAAPEMIAEMVLRLEMVSPNSKRQMLRSIVPWIEKLEFLDVSRPVLDSLMENLLFVTMRYKQDFPREVEQLWTTVARTNKNLQVVIRELISIGMARQNTDIIPLAKFVCIYLARTASKVVIDTLVAELSAGEMIGGSRRNTLTLADRANLQRHRTTGSIASGTFSHGGNTKNGVSSLGGSQSNSQTSMPSFQAEIDGAESGSSGGSAPTHRTLDATSLDRGDRPRSQTHDMGMGARLPLPSSSAELRRGSTGSRDKDNIPLGTTATTTTSSKSPLPMRSESAQDIRSSSDPSVLSSHKAGPASQDGTKDRDTNTAKDIMPPLMAAESPHDGPTGAATTSASTTASKVRPPASKKPRRVSNLLSFSNIGSSDDEDSSGTSASAFFGVHPFLKLIPALAAPWGLTRAHFILTILAQLTYETSEQFRDHLPIIFQLAFLGIDFPNPLVYEHCRIILLNIIHSLIVLPLEQLDNRTWALQEKYSEAQHLVEYLRANQGEPLWAHEDVTMKKPEIKSASQLTSLVQAIIKAFSPANRTPLPSAGGPGSDLAETWAAQALSWAVHGQSWHITGRSFQIYRALRPAITRDAQNDLLECLLRSMSTKSGNKRKSHSSNPKSGPMQTRENLALTIEVLITLQTLVRAQSAQKLILFPQMFWTSVALLHTDYDQHYLASLKLLSDLLDRLDLSDCYVQNIFSASIPKEWDPPFRGIQHLVARGLFSSTTESKAVDVMSKLILIPFDQILHPEPGRLFHTIICLLPFVCSNIRSTIASSSSSSSLKRQSAEIAESISQACSQQRLPELSRIFARLSRFEYESTEEFIWDFKRPFGNALTQLQSTVLAGTYKSPYAPFEGTASHATGSTTSSLVSSSSATSSAISTASTSRSGFPTDASLGGSAVSGSAAAVTNSASGSTVPSATLPHLAVNSSANLAHSSTHGPDDDSSGTHDGAEQKPFFKLETALSILFNVLEHSTSQWRRSTLLLIFCLLQHRYPPPSALTVAKGSSSSQNVPSVMMSVQGSSTIDNSSSATPIATTLTTPSTVETVQASRRGSTSSSSAANPPVDSLERVLHPSWLVTLLKQMSSSSWQQALLILDLALQHSAITVSELDPFLLKTSRISSASTPASSANVSPVGKKKGKSQEIFSNRNSTGVASASLALDKILSTEHRKRNLTLDSSVLSIFDGWYARAEEAAAAAAAASASSKSRKRLSSIMELDASIDIDESISTEDQISYLLQTENKGTGTKADPFDALSTPVPAATLGRFPTFRGFDELLSKLESMPSTPMTTLDSKPAGLFSDPMSTLLDSSSTTDTVVRKISSKKSRSKLLNVVSSSNADASDTTTTDVTASRSEEPLARSPTKVSRSILKSSSSSLSSSSSSSSEEVRRSNSYKFRMSLEPRSSSHHHHHNMSGAESQTESQAESDTNDSDTGSKLKTPSKGSLKVKREKSHSNTGSIQASSSITGSSSTTAQALPSSPSASRRAGASSQPSSSSDLAPLSDPVRPKANRGSTSSKVQAATLKATPSNKIASSPNSRSGSTVIKRSKTATPSSASSKYPSGVSDDPSSGVVAPGSPVGSARIPKKLEFSFTSELLSRTKRWRATLTREPSSELTSDDLPALFKVFSSATKLLAAIRSDFRSGLTLYCRLVIPTNRTWYSSSKLAHDPSAPHKALSELLARFTSESDSIVPTIPAIMIDMMPLKYKRIVKRDVAFATAFRDQRTKLIDEVKQTHISYTEQRVATENIKARLQEFDHDDFEMGTAHEEKDELYLSADRAAVEFAIAVLQLHLITLTCLQIQASIGPIVGPLLESYNPESYASSKDTINTEMARTRSQISKLQSELGILN